MKKLPVNQKSSTEQRGMSRRQFVKVAGTSALYLSSVGAFRFSSQGVSILVDPADKVAGLPESQWAVDELEKSLATRGINVTRCKKLADARNGDLCIAAGGPESSPARELLKNAKIDVPRVPESLAIVPATYEEKQILLACGNDARGLVYALLELADRVNCSDRPFDAIATKAPIVEQPANATRSLTRLFVSETEDKPWYYDRAIWKEYLTTVATQRFNRFGLSLGIGYDFLQNVTDAYFLFAYPFFLQVPGYGVRVPQLPDAEREKNLDTLKFISDQTAARGMQFQLGLWMHGYQWLNSPHPNYTIEGLTSETHAPYCRDALRQLLQACPSISGVTLRTHGESGVNEGSYRFWRTIFEGVATCGRNVGIDLHAKGIDQTMIDGALDTGVQVTVSPKYWAEHLGMSYHQADIREFDIPKPGEKTTDLMKLSTGSRSFIRYGYGDLLKEDRRYTVMHRVWPGTQRLLLWGDPALSAAHARAFGFCGSDGVELMEPLSFKGRRGTGIAGGRCSYADVSLNPRWDWQKYLYSLRVFGRTAYNPSTNPNVWRRWLVQQFGDGAEDVEQALANATRILPIVLTTHGVSAANNLYWPELYTNFSISDPSNENPYFDTPSPKVFGNVSPMDPQLFLRINDFAGELLKGERSGKYTPIEYAQWIEDYADEASKHLARAETMAKGSGFRRMAVDVKIQAGLGHFFGAKFRSAILYAIYEQSGDRGALELAVQWYRKARSSWAELSEVARGVYTADITVGEQPYQRGHWLDRLPAIDEDIAMMAGKLDQAPAQTTPQPENVRLAIQEAVGRPARPSVECSHVQPERFKVGKPLELELSVGKEIASARMYYRHVNHAERWRSMEMQETDKRYRAAIPADYTNSEYPLQYYFELKEAPASAWLYPGFAEDLMNQPYFVVRSV